MAFKKQKQYRLSGWDYRTENEYFITICTKAKTPFFGEVVLKPHGPFVQLSMIGHIAKSRILDLLQVYSNLHVGNWQIMSDHIHLLLELQVYPDLEASPVTGLQPLQKNSVSSIINHYKGNVTKDCRALGFTEFAWQARFHDRVIRDAEELKNVSGYIDSNPERWLKAQGIL